MWQWNDLTYFFSPRDPISLGAEGQYRFDELRSNRFVQVHGFPTHRGVFAREGRSTYVLVGLRDTPLVVRREPLPNERWSGEGNPPQPDQRPFAVRGRLVRAEEASRYEDGFTKLAQAGEVRPREGRLWLVVEGERPGQDLGLLVEVAAIVLLLATNLYFAVRRI